MSRRPAQYRPHRPRFAALAAWLALVGILFAAVLPAHAAMRTGAAGTVSIELCTRDGLQQVTLPDPAGQTDPAAQHSDRGAGPCLGCAAAPGPLLALAALSVWIEIERPAAPLEIERTADGIASLRIERLPATGPPRTA